MKNFIKTSLILFLIFLVIFGCLAVWAFKIEQRLVFINKKHLYVPDNNNKLEGLKVAVISDLHLGSRYINENKLEKIVSAVNNQAPDLIFILGDIDAKLITENYKNTLHITNCFKKLKSRHGTYAIYGNHDFKPANIVEPIYRNSNISLLIDSSVNIKTKKGNIFVAGLNDKWGHNTKKSISEVIANIPENEPIILLSHNPDVFPNVPARVNLTLSGHNHGGQICLPILGGFFIPSAYGQRYLKGYIVENNKHLFVSKGIGNLAPIRFGSIPEINILILHSQTKNNLIINTKPRTGIKTNFMYHYPKIRKIKLLQYIK